MTDRIPVLVTGGAGYIGSHACKSLHGAGFLPIAYDSLVFGHEWAVKWGPLERGDITDEGRLSAVIRQYRPQAVMHFAAFAFVGESVTNPAKYYANNVGGSLVLLEAMRDNGIDKLVFSSTCATHGMSGVFPIAEDQPQRPVNPYGMTKFVVERMLADFDTAYGLKSLSLRYFNAAGADPDAEIGEDHDPETHLVPLVLDTLIGRRSTLTIFGDDYETDDGTCIRDYIHVSDLASAHVLALEALLGGSDSQAYNLGNGKGFSVHQVIATAEDVTGKEVPVAVGPRRAGDPAILVADAARARKQLGWRPRYDSIETIIGTAWAWHKRHFGQQHGCQNRPGATEVQA